MIFYSEVKTFAFLFIAALTAGFSIQAQTFQNIEELDITTAQQSYSALVKNKSVSGETISVAG